MMADDVARVLGKSWLHFAGGSRGKVRNLAGTKRGAVRGSKSERICLCREWEPFALGNGGWLQVAVGRLRARPLRLVELLFLVKNQPGPRGRLRGLLSTVAANPNRLIVKDFEMDTLGS